MEEKTFPRGGGKPTATSTGSSRATSRNKQHKLFPDEADGTGEEESTSHRVVDHETNLFTKLKKQKLHNEQRKEGAKLRAKKNKSKVEQLVREEEKIVEHLTYSTLAPGMLLLGRIKEFLGSDIAVTLPGGLRGFVSPFDISDVFTKRLQSLDDGIKSEDEEVQNLLQLFAVGRIVVCKVKDVEKSHVAGNSTKQRVTVRLTMNPRDIVPDLVNHLFNGVVIPATVLSIEDHGYAMDIGLGSKGVRSFLPKGKAVVDGEVNAPILEEGQVLLCSVESGGISSKNPAARALQLNRNVSAVRFLEKNVSPANLLPGAIVDVKVEMVKDLGLRVHCGSAQGFVSRFHLINSADSPANHKESEVISARVLYTNPVTKQTAFTLKTSFWDAQTWNSHSHGDLYEGLVVPDAEIVAVVEGVGIYLRLQGGQLAFAARKNLGVPPSDPIKSVFKSGTMHTCVVTGFNDMDEMVLVSLKENLINQPFLSYHHLSLGQVVDCKIVALVPSGVVVLIGERIQGFVPASHLSEVALKNWQQKFTEKTTITCKVMELDAPRKNLVLTHKKSLIDAKDLVLQSYEDAIPDYVVTGVISKIRDTGMLVRFFQKVHGWVPMSEFVEGISLENLYYEGQTVKCKVLRVDKKTQNLQLSLRLIKSDPEKKFKESSEVVIVKECRVTRISPKGLDVRVLPSEAAGFIPFFHLADNADDCVDRLNTFKLSQIIPEAVILKMTPLFLSMKPAYIEAANLHDIPTTIREVHVGREIVATVSNIKNYGVFVEVANGVGGLLPNRLVATLSSERPLSVGDSVLVKTEEVHEEQGRLLFRLLNRIGDAKVEQREPLEKKVRSGTVQEVNEKPVLGSGKHNFGDIVTAKVIAVESQRLKLRTPAKMIGHVHKSELSDQLDSKKADLHSYHVGQILSARVIGQKEIVAKKSKGRRVLTKKATSKPPIYQFSTRRSVLTARDDSVLQKLLREKRSENVKPSIEIKQEEDVDMKAFTRTSKAPVAAHPHAADSRHRTVTQLAHSLLPRLTLPSFSWDDEGDQRAVDLTDDSTEEQAQVKRRKLDIRNEERRTYDNERSLIKEEVDSHTADDFEKLVLASPNSSISWVRFMAFLLQKQQVAEAKSLARRALETISFREETERFNVWVALLNLENLHGTKESMENTFHDALQHNDALKVFRQMAAIYANTGKLEDAETTYKKMTSRFKASKEVWMDYGAFLMANGKHEAAHQLMQRSLQVIDQKSQIDIIVKFALLELQHGSKERAKTMFENLLANYPKRSDLLHMYASQLIKAKEPAAEIRKLFERIVHTMKFPAKKMKVFFKRYLEFEEENGTPATVEHVKKSAQTFVEQYTL
ncbi:Protein RRP5-like protein [Hypsibius exemplaris]|uniref:Protein RRP5-like protein n=1 Tax=Hypsibius exemplaris TaxID=2072580 RepID=A0A1W0XDH5_HYPEX|nr:Protein RRP5-like protein [Hypsibius exemplaris]